MIWLETGTKLYVGPQTFEPTRESLDHLIERLKASIEQRHFADPPAQGVTLLLAEMLKHALERIDRLEASVQP